LCWQSTTRPLLLFVAVAERGKKYRRSGTDKKELRETVKPEIILSAVGT
jgi:hypothetical protein